MDKKNYTFKRTHPPTHTHSNARNTYSANPLLYISGGFFFILLNNRWLGGYWPLCAGNQFDVGMARIIDTISILFGAFILCGRFFHPVATMDKCAEYTRFVWKANGACVCACACVWTVSLHNWQIYFPPHVWFAFNSIFVSIMLFFTSTFFSSLLTNV